MSIYSVSGVELSALYDVRGIKLTQAYDIDGDQLIIGDYDEWETEYQHTILQARDAWAAEYRADNTVIPLILHTDQHGYLNAAHKPTFDYLAKAVKWDEISAIVGLGDVCGSSYGTSYLNAMKNCLSGIPQNKQINVAGNHDVWAQKPEGSSYSYGTIDDATFSVLQNTYFANSQFGDGANVRYGNRGNEYVLDSAHHVKYCIFSTWYFGEGGEPYYSYRLSTEAANAMIAMLGANDGYDLVILAHIQPYYRKCTRYFPAVDGDEAHTEEIARKSESLSSLVALDQLIADRKAKRAGTITDADGVTHSYDFSPCTTDLLCVLNGHWHLDSFAYSPDGTVPAVEFDAYHYDNCPLYFLNIDRTKQRVNVWKFDEANQIYNYQVPFLESGMESGEGAS